MAKKNFKKPTGGIVSENLDNIYGDSTPTENAVALVESSPALVAASSSAASPEVAPQFIVPEGYKIVPESCKIAPESKSRRVQVLLTPSLHDRLKSIAAKEKTSVNDLVNLGLEKTYPA